MAYSMHPRLLDILHSTLQQCRSVLESDLAFLVRDVNPKTGRVYSNALNEVNSLSADLNNQQNLDCEDFKHLIFKIHCEVVWITGIYRYVFGDKPDLAVPSMAYLLDMIWPSDPVEDKSELTVTSDDVTVKEMDSGESSSLVEEEEESSLLPSTLPSIDNTPDIGSDSILTAPEFPTGSSHSAAAAYIVSSCHVSPAQVHAYGSFIHGDKNGFGSTTNPLLTDYGSVIPSSAYCSASCKIMLSAIDRVFTIWSLQPNGNVIAIQSGTDPPLKTTDDDLGDSSHFNPHEYDHYWPIDTGPLLRQSLVKTDLLPAGSHPAMSQETHLLHRGMICNTTMKLR